MQDPCRNKNKRRPLVGIFGSWSLPFARRAQCSEGSPPRELTFNLFLRFARVSTSGILMPQFFNVSSWKINNCVIKVAAAGFRALYAASRRQERRGFVCVALGPNSQPPPVDQPVHVCPPSFDSDMPLLSFICLARSGPTIPPSPPPPSPKQAHEFKRAAATYKHETIKHVTISGGN